MSGADTPFDFAQGQAPPARGLNTIRGHVKTTAKGGGQQCPPHTARALRILPPQLARFTERVIVANNWQHRPAGRRYPLFRHVVYIIKENRTLSETRRYQRVRHGQ